MQYLDDSIAEQRRAGPLGFISDPGVPLCAARPWRQCDKVARWAVDEYPPIACGSGSCSTVSR